MSVTIQYVIVQMIVKEVIVIAELNIATIIIVSIGAAFRVLWGTIRVLVRNEATNFALNAVVDHG